MSNNSISKIARQNWPKHGVPLVYLCKGASLAAALVLLMSVVGCQSPSSKQAGNYETGSAGRQGLAPDEQKAMAELTRKAAASGTTASTGSAKANAVAAESLVLREGDAVRITFPGAPNLNALQPIRRDGKISLQLVGEVQAAGKTPSALEKELIDLYGPQLQVKEISVNIESSAFPVYVTGAVLRPGKILSDRPMNALEAIMEAGGFDYTKANLKTVRVIRNNDGRIEHYQLNLREVINGKKSDMFDLKPSDIIYVPERFTWF